MIGQQPTLRYTHCVFNGALPSYCTRSDTKDDYHYLDSEGDDQGNGLCGYTNDILMITSPLRRTKESITASFATV